ncbi:MAG: cobD [Ilumatobacteraceae bacterium]|nr:cobD [Ilumatobacteraceae bacterium]
MVAPRGVAVAVGLAADLALGEPPLAVHPVAAFGRAMEHVERALYRDRRLNGVAFCALGVGGAAAIGWGVQRIVGRPGALALTTFAAVAGRMLADEANVIGSMLVRGDLDAARAQLPALVGRSPDGLDASEITRAVVESVAENAIDAVVAPALWALVGGAPAVCAYRAANTVDAMVGHHSARYEHFGWASARLDDIANWFPARVGAAVVAVLRPSSARDVLRTVRRDAHQHPSPNGGVIESAFAASLGVRLGGSNRYGDTVEHRGVLGDGRVAQPTDIAAATRLLRRMTLTIAAAGSIIGAVVPVVRRVRAD